MPTSKACVDFILQKLRNPGRFTAKAMFGEYALYADGVVVALICDEQLYVKILPASAPLESLCEKGEPYPKAKSHYVVDEPLLSQIDSLPSVLFAIAASRPQKSKKRA